MSRNLSQGPILVADVTVTDINQALIELQERLDNAKGLRGRALIYDRVRIDDPTLSDDAVSLGKLQAGTAFSNVTFLASGGAGLVAFQPGTTYTELAETLRQQVNFEAVNNLEARVIAQAWGSDVGTSKAIAFTQDSGAVIAEVVWDGTAEGLKVGDFTPVILDTDQLVQVHVKGSTATESLVLRALTLDVRYSIDVIRE